MPRVQVSSEGLHRQHREDAAFVTREDAIVAVAADILPNREWTARVVVAATAKGQSR